MKIRILKTQVDKETERGVWIKLPRSTKKFWLPKSFCDTDNKMIVAKIPSYFNFIIFRGQKGNEIREKVSYEQILRMTVNNDYHSINNVLVHVPSKMEVVEVEVPNELKR